MKYIIIFKNVTKDNSEELFSIECANYSAGQDGISYWNGDGMNADTPIGYVPIDNLLCVKIKD